MSVRCEVFFAHISRKVHLSMSVNQALLAPIDEAEKAAIDAVREQFVKLRAQVLGAAFISGLPPMPTIEQARDPQNKQENGINLSERGIEVVYRLYDHGSSVRKVSRMLDISQQAAKWRKGKYLQEGGAGRPRKKIDLDA